MKAVAVLALALLASGAQAEVYKWVDDKGVTHYGSSLPPAAEQQKARAAPVETGITADPPSAPARGYTMGEQLEIVGGMNDEIRARREAARQQELAEQEARMQARQAARLERRMRFAAAAANDAANAANAASAAANAAAAAAATRR